MPITKAPLGSGFLTEVRWNRVGLAHSSPAARMRSPRARMVLASRACEDSARQLGATRVGKWTDISRAV